MGDLKVYLFSAVSRAAAAAAKGGGERGEFSLQRSINKGKLIFGEPKVKVVGVIEIWCYKMLI